MYFVFVCRKCGHKLYVHGNKDNALTISALQEIAAKECPNCGEQGEENWALGFKSRGFPGEDGDDNAD